MRTKRKGISAAFDMVLYITMLALILMVVAFITGMYAVLCHSQGIASTACVIGCFFFLVLTHAALSEVSPTYQRLKQLIGYGLKIMALLGIIYLFIISPLLFRSQRRGRMY